MSKVNKVLLMLIAMVAIMLVAVGIDKGMKYMATQKWEQERMHRYEETYAEAANMQMTIEELSKDQQAIEDFIEENQDYFQQLEEQEVKAENLWEGAFEENAEDMGDEGAQEALISENDVQESGEDISSDNVDDDPEAQVTVSENDVFSDDPEAEPTVSENNIEEDGQRESVSGNSVSGNELKDTVSGNQLENSVSQNGLESSVSENTLPEGFFGESMMQSTVSGNDLSLQEKRKLNSSYIETQIVNTIDKQIIANSQIDFSDVKITCLGDSITAATNLEKLENYQQYSYPARLQTILGAEKVVNLGIGGSSIGRYWADAFVDRYQEIPADSDIIIVMGGTNDGFCLNKEEFGTMQERAPRTFIGDLNELMLGLKEAYPDALVVFATPLPNVLHDMLRKERDYLLPQKELADAIKLLAAEHQLPVIDLYNSNILDSHDAAVIFNYMPDGVHGNAEGYQVLAEHMAAELIKLYEAGQQTIEAD